ncbi:RNA polymerase III subunit RPC82 [Xylariaceae sp. FL0804]|nr:RNA polymerase III subunit RPC82 [Xylariaceae sp. FL0804]
MLVTKNAAELCVLLITELFGQLPSRVFAGLLSKGRSTAAQLASHTGLTLKQVRHGIVVLIQQDLLFFQTDNDQAITLYEANPDAAYNLVRVGRILDIIDTKYGSTAKQLVHEVLVLGRVEIGSLIRYHNREHRPNGEAVNGETRSEPDHVNGDVNGHSNHINGNRASYDSHVSAEEKADQTEQVYDILADLIAAGFVEVVDESMLHSPQDRKSAVEQEVTRKEYPNGVRGAKQTEEFDAYVKNRLRELQEKRTELKRHLQNQALLKPSIKRRKLDDGRATNRFQQIGAGVLLHDEHATVIRLNYEKCIVEIRNQKLADYAEDFIGETTAQVYAALLTALTEKVYRCQPDGSEPDERAEMGFRVTTLDIFEHLGSSVDVSLGIGTASEDTIDVEIAERISRHAPYVVSSDFQGQEHELADIDDIEYDHSGEALRGSSVNGNHSGPPAGPNGHRAEHGAHARNERLLQMRQHLLLLAESKQQFVRHCGSQGHGEWTVDFGPLMSHLRFVELDTMIEESFGRQGLRLTRILREKGKIDDKTLPTMALMRKPDVHVKMAEMEMAGFLDVQEVPRDNNRAANRTIFLWFFDEQRTLKRVLDNTYKSMVRCYQRLEVERRKKRNVLSVAERRDVQGMEEEKLRGDIYNDYLDFIRIETRLLGQITRLDDLVAVLRDY